MENLIKWLCIRTVEKMCYDWFWQAMFLNRIYFKSKLKVLDSLIISFVKICTISALGIFQEQITTGSNFITNEQVRKILNTTY